MLSLARTDHIQEVVEQWTAETPTLDRSAFAVIGRISRLAHLLEWTQTETDDPQSHDDEGQHHDDGDDDLDMGERGEGLVGRSERDGRHQGAPRKGHRLDSIGHASHL